MGIALAVAIVLAVCITILFAAILAFIRRIDEDVMDTKALVAHLFDVARGLREEIDEVKSTPAKVTDPFEKPKEIYQSTKHIIVPKTPDEIRNENFNKIREGAEYGSAT